MTESMDVAEILWAFKMTIGPLLVRADRECLEKEYEDEFFEVLGSADNLTFLDVKLWPRPMRALFDHLVFQYIGVLTHHDLEFPEGILEGSSDEVLHRRLLEHLAERRWLAPSEVPWKERRPQ